MTTLRPVRFMTNWLGVSGVGIDGIVDGVHRHLFPPDEPMQIVAPEDIADFEVLRIVHPGLRTLDAWLAESGCGRHSHAMITVRGP